MKKQHKISRTHSERIKTNLKPSPSYRRINDHGKRIDESESRGDNLGNEFGKLHKITLTLYFINFNRKQRFSSVIETCLKSNFSLQYTHIIANNSNVHLNYMKSSVTVEHVDNVKILTLFLPVERHNKPR